MRGRTFILVVFMFVSLSPLPAVWAEPKVTADQLIYLTEEYPPYNYTENNQLKGMSVDMLRLMWKKMGIPPQPIKVDQWAHAYNWIQHPKPGEYICLFGMGRIPSREKLFKWVGPYTRNKISLFARKDSGIKLTSFEDAKKYKIGTLRDDISENELLNRGFPKKMMVRDTKIARNLKKLAAKRIDLLCHNERSIDNQMKELGLNPDDFEVVLPLAHSESCYAFSLNVPDDLVAQFQAALESLEPERAQLEAHYFK